MGDDHLFLSIDVTSLYTNIPNELGHVALSWYITHRYTRWMPPALRTRLTTAVTSLMSVIQKTNGFVYDNDLFPQIQGTAMGSPAAVVYADIVMLYLENRYILPILEGEGLEVQVYRRFISDIFVSLHGCEGQVQRALDRINKCSALEFAHELAHDSIDFLDTTVFRSKGYMAVKPHFKVTNRFLYLLAGSNHPRSMGKGVITGELIRIRRSSTLDHHYEAAAEQAKQTFRGRPQPPHLLAVFCSCFFSTLQQSAMIAAQLKRGK